MADIKIYGKLTAMTEDQTVADTTSIQDTTKSQKLNVTLNAIAESISSLETTVSGKQSSLTASQLSAANSGITSEKVSQYDSAVTAVSNLGSAANKNTGTSAGNVPVLDSNGKLPTSVMPALSLTETFVVNSESSMLSLTAQPGDVAVRTDINKCFILKTAGASSLSNWQELLTPTYTVPTKLSDLTNDSGFITSSYHDSSKQDNLSEAQMNAANSGITAGKVSNYDSHLNNSNVHVTSTEKSTWNAKQNALIFDSTPTASSPNPVSSAGIKTALDGKQDTLVSGTNIKTINGQSILGSGNIEISCGSSSGASATGALCLINFGSVSTVDPDPLTCLISKTIVENLCSIASTALSQNITIENLADYYANGDVYFKRQVISWAVSYAYVASLWSKKILETKTETTEYNGQTIITKLYVITAWPTDSAAPSPYQNGYQLHASKTELDNVDNSTFQIEYIGGASSNSSVNPSENASSEGSVIKMELSCGDMGSTTIVSYLDTDTVRKVFEALSSLTGTQLPTEINETTLRQYIGTSFLNFIMIANLGYIKGIDDSGDAFGVLYHPVESFDHIDSDPTYGDVIKITEYGRYGSPNKKQTDLFNLIPTFTSENLKFTCVSIGGSYATEEDVLLGLGVIDLSTSDTIENRN